MRFRILLFGWLLMIGIAAGGEVSITQVDHGFRVEIDGKLFTEWQTKAWAVPYLYPVIGPDGENITRNFPMKTDVAGESQDHPHHRSIRFSHRDINGASFWSPDRPTNGKATKIDLVKIKKMESGETGELVLENSWKINGEELIRETLRLAFYPLANGEVLFDYDTKLVATGDDVTFGDNKDGGMGIRVASTMVVKSRVTKTGNGHIVNSNGDRDVAAWGKRAKWADYYGPGVSGKVVGVAIFDHPENVRHPVHWHARDYGLMTANRFGAGHFEKASGAKMGVGEYTVKKGDSLKLRHRFYLHHGDTEEAKVAQKYTEYLSGGH